MKVHYLAALVVLSLGAIGCGGSNGHFLYVVGPGTNTIFGFRQNATGILIPLSSSSSTDSIPDSIAIHPSGKLVFVANFGGGTVTVFARSTSNGGLAVSKDPVTNNQIGPVSVGTGPIALAVNSTGQFLYVLNQGQSNIAVFSIDSTTGNLTGINGSPFATPASPRSMALAANGKLLYVANPTLGTVTGFTVAAGGNTVTVPGSPFAAGTAPSWVTIDSQAKFLYVADAPNNAIRGFTIDSSSGALAPISGSPFPAGTHPVALGIDSKTSLLVAANQGSNNISAYSISSSGALTQLSGSPFLTGGTAPVFVTVDTTNSFVYAADSTSNDVAAFAISNGKLGGVSGSPFTITTSPAWITLQ